MYICPRSKLEFDQSYTCIGSSSSNLEFQVWNHNPRFEQLHVVDPTYGTTQNMLSFQRGQKGKEWLCTHCLTETVC